MYRIPSDNKAEAPVIPRARNLKSVLVLSLTNLETDPRVNRQIRVLSAKYRVVAAGAGDPGVDGVEYVSIPQIPKPLALKAIGALKLKLGQYEKYYWMDRRVQLGFGLLANRHFDLIIANDLVTLPLALKLSGGARVVYDAHEYSPGEYEDSRFWRFFFQRYNHYLCDKYLSAADAMLTVCESIADEYRNRYGVAAKVVMNTPAYQDLAPAPAQSGIVRLVHHGGATSSRRLELMIETMDLLDDRFQLDMMLVPSVPRYLEYLKTLAAKRPRVRILPPVPMRELPKRLNQYDIGIYLLPPNSFNNCYALPNKFFEFIQARLAVAIGPSPEMARLVRKYDCGVVADEFTREALARQLNALDDIRIGHYKARSHAAAAELCFEKGAEALTCTVERLIS